LEELFGQSEGEGTKIGLGNMIVLLDLWYVICGFCAGIIWSTFTRSFEVALIYFTILRAGEVQQRTSDHATIIMKINFLIKNLLVKN